MTEINTVELLEKAFPGMDIAILKQISLLATINKYPSGTVLCMEGDPGDTFYLIQDGEILFTKKMDAQETRTLRKGGAGDFFGEMAALLPGSARNATVTAMTDVTTVELDHKTFETAIMENPAMAFAIVRTMIDRMRMNDIHALNDLRKQKEQLEFAYDELRRYEEQRNEFMDTLAHELKTPLTTAKGYIQLIKAGMIDGATFDKAVDKISNSFNRIISLVNDLLFVQEMELLDFGFYRVDVRDVLRDIVRELEGMAAEQKAMIRLDIADDVPTILADYDGLVRAFRHLLDNAIKFSPEGGDIVVAVRHKITHIELDFIDQGVGIPPEFMPRLFKRFERMESYQGYLFGGVGLGLPIVKHIVESHEGMITVQSTPGKGSTFHVRLPLEVGRSTVQIEPAREGEEWVDAEDYVYRDAISTPNTAAEALPQTITSTGTMTKVTLTMMQEKEKTERDSDIFHVPAVETPIVLAADTTTTEIF